MNTKNFVTEKAEALKPANIYTDPGNEFLTQNRIWQGIPGVERSKSGRLLVAFYSGGINEGADNYILLVNSGDDGKTWTEPILAIDPPGSVKAFDPCLWHDPLGRLWLFWAQAHHPTMEGLSVWAIVCQDSDLKKLQWSTPRRIANGIMLNKPLVLSTGEWLFPIAGWKESLLNTKDFIDERFSNIYCSRDCGETISLIGKADVPERHFDEHMIIERRDGSLWMLVRASCGIGESFSYDKGYTWTPGDKTLLGGPNSRFFIRRLKSGRLLLINHYKFIGRSNLTAMLSDDDGINWNGYLTLDERSDVSYPDAIEGEDGYIYAVYDRERAGDGSAKEILMAAFTEEDVMLGRCASNKVKLKVVVNKIDK